MADCKCREEGCAICDPPFKSAIQEELAALRAQLAERDAEIKRLKEELKKGDE